MEKVGEGWRRSERGGERDAEGRRGSGLWRWSEALGCGDGRRGPHLVALEEAHRILCDLLGGLAIDIRRHVIEVGAAKLLEAAHLGEGAEEE